MKWRLWRTANEMAADFAANRSPESDANYIADCGLPATPIAQRVALAVRRSVASYGMIDSQFIRASDRYPDQLIDLSGWDSLDFLGWLFELERELDLPVPLDVFEYIRDPFSVADLVQAVLAFLEQQAEPNAAQH